MPTLISAEALVQEIAMDHPIMQALEEALKNPLLHGIFRLEIYFRDYKASRFVTATENSYLLENNRTS